jgi:hypothetical protein
MRPPLQRIQNGEIDPSFVITHRMKLGDAPHGYSIFNDKQDECLKIVAPFDHGLRAFGSVKKGPLRGVRPQLTPRRR